MAHCLTWHRLKFMRDMLEAGYSVVWADALYVYGSVEDTR